MKNVPLHRIDWPDENNGRERVDWDHVERLARQIKTVGLLHPITVRPVGNRFVGIAGRHRFLAFQRLNRETIPAIIRSDHGETDDAARYLENVTRKSLTPIEEARQLHTLVEQHPRGVDGVADDTGRKVEWILDRLELLEYPDEIQQALHERTITLGVARALVRIRDPQYRAECTRNAILHGVNAKTAALWAQQDPLAANEQSTASHFSRENHVQVATMETTIICFGCEDHVRLEHTRPYRICHTCIERIQLAKSGLPDPEEPTTPTPHETPPTPERVDAYPPQAYPDRLS